MELVMALIVGVLFAGGTYMLLRPNFIRVVMGLGLFSNAANLLLITCGGFRRANDAPFVSKGQSDFTNMMDPIPPDIILTAIVISFAVGALLLIVSYRVYLDHGTDNPEEIPNLDENEHSTGASQIPDLMQALSQPRAASGNGNPSSESRLLCPGSRVQSH
jgi:multicomponent Na+:H+ antiporter subunit C